MTQSETEKNLSDLKIGDIVAIRVGYSEAYSIFQITDVSARGIITISNGTKYRADGSPMAKSGKWSIPTYIQRVTDEVIQANRKYKLVSRLNGLDINYWKTVDLETLEAVAALIWKPEV